MSNNFASIIKEFTKDIETMQQENAEVDIKIEQLNQEISEEENKLHRTNFISSEVNKEKSEHVSMVTEYTNILHNIKNCNGDKNKLKAFITSLGDTYDENIDYESIAQKTINECNFMLESDHIEKQVIDKINNRINNLKASLDLLLAFKESNNIDSCIANLDIYTSFSMPVLEKVVKRFNNYHNLSKYEKICYYDNLLIEIQLLFNECFNKVIEESQDPKSFLRDYLLLMLSSFNINKILYNSEGFVFDENAQLITELNNSRLRTQTIFMSKLIHDEESTNQILFMNYLNQMKLPSGSETITQKQPGIL